MIFSEKNNELTLFGKTLTDVQSKLSKYTMSNVKEQLTPDEQLTKILSDNEASDIVNTLNKIKDKSSEKYASFDDYFKELDEKGKGYIADYVKENQNQIYVTEEVIDASKKARQNQIAHNEVVQQSTLAFKASKVAMQGLAMAGNMIASMGISLVVSKAIEYFTELANTVNNTREAAEGFSSSISEYNSNLSKNKSSLNDLNSRYKELSKGVGTFGQNLTLSTSEYEEYKNIISQVSDIMPDLALRYNEQGEKIGFVKNQLVDLNEEYKKYQQNEARKLIVEGDENGNTIQDTLDYYKQTTEGVNVFGDEGVTSWKQAWGDGFKEVFSLGFANTFESTYTSDKKKKLFESLQNSTNKKEATNILSDYTGFMDADEERQVFGASMGEIKKMSDDEFKIWQKSLDGYVDKYSSEVETANNRLKESIGVLAHSRDDYWDESVSDNERTAISSFLSNMTGEMLEGFKDENGNISQGTLNNFTSEIIDSFSNDKTLYDAFNSVMSESFKDMPYQEAVSSLNKYIATISEKTGFTKEQLLHMFGFEGDIANMFLGEDTNKMTDEIKSKLNKNFVDESGKTANAFAQIDKMSFDELLKAYEVMQNIGAGEKITWNELLNQMSQLEETSDEIVTSLENYNVASNSISSLSSAFKELSDNGYLNLDTISQVKEAVGDNISNWDEYEQKLLTVQKGSDEFNQIMGELTYATLEGKLGVKGLAEADEKYIASILRENGVLNANTTAHDMVTAAREKARVQAYIQEQGLDTLISTLANEENALMVQASACGLSTNAYAALLAQEIAFSTNDMNVSDKLTKLSTIAVQAGLAAIEVEKLNTVMNGKGLKEDFATENGIGVIKTPGRTTKDKNGKTVANWQYEYNGVVYESLDDAYFAKEYDELMNKLETPTPTVTYSNTNSSNNSSAVQETKETFNWIETALSRAQRAVTNFGKTVAATWQSWKVRNEALKDQMSAIRNEISLQDQAYSKYMTLAESVGLSEGYKNLVQSGTIDISTIRGKSLTDAINQYQEYYEKALAAKDASADLKDELAALAQTKFSNLAQSFADLMSGNDHTISMYEATIDLMEKRGYTASASLYDSLKDAEQKNQDILKNKYTALNQALDEAVDSKTIEIYSEQWYQMQNEILAVEEAIIQSNIALAEYDNALRDLEWSAFDKLHEEISEIYEETEFLDKLLSDEKKFNEDGSMTDAGQAALGLDVVNYKTHLAQAEEYAQELERIKEALAKDPYNQDLLDRQDELEEKHREVLTQIEDDEQSMIDTVSEGYDTLLDHMDQMIDKRKNMLSQAKDLYEYEKNISKQTQEIASLEKQLAAYQGDDSEEARATIQKLQVSLSEAKENLEETEYEKYISDQEQMLDTLRLQTEEWINARLDNEDQLLKDIVSSTEQNAAMIKDTLTEVASSAGTTLSEVMNTFWSNDGDIGKAMTEIKNYLAGMQKNSEEKAKEQVQNNTPASSNSGNPPTPAPTSSTPATTSAPKWGDFFVKKSDSYPKNKLNTETSIVDRLKYSNLDSSFSARSQYYTPWVVLEYTQAHPLRIVG